MRLPMEVPPKITKFDRGQIDFDLSGMDRKSIRNVLRVCMGRSDEDTDEWLDRLMGKNTVVSHFPNQKDYDRGGGFERITFESDYIQPYLDRLKEWTGFEFPEGAEVPLTALNGVFHTHGVISAKIVRRSLTVEAFAHVYLNSNETEIDAIARKEKAHRACLRYIADDLGKTETPREFIEARNGLYKHNPDYASGRPSPIHKCCNNEEVWQEIFGHWFEKYATAGQKEIIARMAHCWSGKKAEFNEKYPSLRDYQGIHLDEYNTHVTIADFKASKVPPVFVPKPKEPAEK